jgi:hypothetical protein
MGRGYAAERFAIIWSQGLEGDQAKAIRTKAWETTRPLPNGDGGAYAAGTFAVEGAKRNPLITARTSNLILVDCDTEEGVAAIAALNLPDTWTVQSSAPYKRHFYFRPPRDAAQLPDVGFRFEEAGFSGDKNRALVCPPALHPSGSVYTFIVGGPGSDVPIAEMPLDVYNELLRRAGENKQQTRAEIQNPDAKIVAGHRSDSVFKYACMQRRWGMSEPAIADACMAFNLERCQPPLSRDQVDHQVHGAMTYPGGEALAGTLTPRSKRDATPPKEKSDGTSLDFIYLADVQMRSVQWLEKPLWQRRGFHLLAGRKGEGKGTYTARLAAKITRGDLPGGARNVVFISSEDSPEIDLAPRLSAAGADLQRCVFVTDTFRLPDDLARLRKTLELFGDVGMLVVDPVANHVGDCNSNSESEVRDAIAPLNQLADELDCLVIGIRHVGKDRTRGAIASILGSTAWVDTPRAVVMIASDDQDAAIRHVQVVAGNRSAQRGGIMFRIEGAMVAGLTESVPMAVELGESHRDLDELFSPDTGKPTTKTAAARDQLLTILEDNIVNGVESDTLDAQVATATGLSAKTVRNVRGELAKEGLIKPRPELDENGQPARWIVYRTGAPRL